MQHRGRTGPRVVVRHARPGDLESLLRLEGELFAADAFTRRQVRHLLTRARALVLVAVCGGRVCGSAVVLLRRGGRAGRLYSLGVERRWQRRGVGRALLRRAERECLARGRTRLSLEVRSTNAAALRLYERCGYAFVEELPQYYGRAAPGWRMAKRLGPAGGPFAGPPPLRPAPRRGPMMVA